MNKHVNKSKAKKIRTNPGFYTKVARVPEEKGKKTYTRSVTVYQAMKLIYGVPNYKPEPRYGMGPSGDPIFMGYENVLTERIPLTRRFVRAKVA